MQVGCVLQAAKLKEKKPFRSKERNMIKCVFAYAELPFII